MNSDTAKNSDTEPTKPLCSACRESIQPGAQLCPHCRSPQSRRKWWQSAVAALKWVGGITAILSLVALSLQLSEVYRNFRKTRISVEALNRAAGQLVANNDLTGALEILDEALQLDPTNSNSRDLKIEISMKRVRTYFGYMASAEWEKSIKPLILNLRRGIGHKSSRTAADVLAHLGWAYSLDDMRNPSIVKYFKNALATDAGNVFGHAMWGGWCVRALSTALGPSDSCGEGALTTAAEHFRLALTQDREQESVHTIAFETLLESSVLRNRAGIEALAYANHLIQKGSDGAHGYGGALIRCLYEIMDYGDAEAELLQKIPAPEIIKMIERIARDPEDKSYLDDVILARLVGLNGDNQEAVNRLRRIRLLVRKRDPGYWPSGPLPSIYIDKAIIKALDLKTGHMGIDVGVAPVTDATSGLRGARIEQVVTGGPAARCGLQPGDIIIAANGMAVRKEDDLIRISGSLPPGEKIMVTLMRQGLEHNIEVTLGPGGEPLKLTGSHSDLTYRIVNRHLYHPVEIYTGHVDILQLAELAPELRSAYAIRGDVHGAINLEHYYTGRMNIGAGEVFMEVNHRAINRPEDVKAAIDAAMANGVSQIPIKSFENGSLKSKTLNILGPKH